VTGIAHSPAAMTLPEVGPGQRLTQVDLAERWHVSPRTLERWRSRGIGPRWIALPGRVLYRIEDVLAYEQAHLHGT